jgi:hypothetical protein
MADTADRADTVDAAVPADEGELVGLARARFPDFTDDERTLLPIIYLHQEDSFEVTGPHARGVRAYLWFQITIGWALATSLAAASSKLIQRNAPSP